MAKKLNVNKIAKKSADEVAKMAASSPVAFGAAIAFFGKLLTIDGFMKAIESEERGEFMELFRSYVNDCLSNLTEEQKEKLGNSINLYLDVETQRRILEQFAEEA